MKCLVTGAGGFIGDSLVRRLTNLNHFVIGLIHKNKPVHPEKKVEYIKGDITEKNTLKNIDKDIEVIFHCAGLVQDYGFKKDFYQVNLEGTKNLVLTFKSVNIKKFIFLGHIEYESFNYKNNYAKTKSEAEKFLLNEYKIEKFPVVIIRPGNVYGPGATTWVLRPLKTIQRNRIALINHGRGIFLHTYIDNLIDALISAMKMPGIIGETIDITDGDNSITWGRYLNDISTIATGHPIKRNLSNRSALTIGKLMIILNRIFRIEPWITPTAVDIFTNKKKISINKAKKLLDYDPKVNYEQGMEQVRKWLTSENYI